ncbi:hypothetical protein [Devosia ginsengisoli]|uniref:hypothetical protein n=1 Tax=Devosia ginsengisoli TaxID=400770 RepID=UPI0026F19943|nr:hypothetical protein [Devosia ginsengisoli]MCR6670310.1 hypothetical protein [Devosia ginsengisoli]
MRLLLTLSLLALAQPALAQTVLETDFTISVPTTPGQPDVVESTTLVPLLADTCYNWHLRLGKVKGAVEIVEILTLPIAADDWGTSDNTVISDDQRTATSTMSLTPDDGWIGHGWCVVEGDPAGDYVIEVKSGDEVLHRFDFELQEM